LGRRLRAASRAIFRRWTLSATQPYRSMRRSTVCT
jgi:hypothetical protein